LPVGSLPAAAARAFCFFVAKDLRSSVALTVLDTQSRVGLEALEHAFRGSTAHFVADGARGCRRPHPRRPGLDVTRPTQAYVYGPSTGSSRTQRYRTTHNRTRQHRRRGLNGLDELSGTARHRSGRRPKPRAQVRFSPGGIPVLIYD
jgi:hypothetical protein